MAYAVFNDGSTEGREPWVDYEFTDEPLVEVLAEKASGQTERVELFACSRRRWGDVTYSDRYNYPGTKAPTEGEVPRPAAEGSPAAVQASREVSVVDLVGIPEEEARTLRRKLPIKAGDTLSRSKLLEGVEKIHEYFARRGRLESRVDPDVENLPDGSAGVTYTIDPGPRVEVSVEGVRGTTRKRLEKAFAGYSRETPYNESFYLDAADVLRGRLVGRGIPGARASPGRRRPPLPCS